MEGADVRGAVAELAQDDTGRVGLIECERRADRDRQVPADDAPAAVEAALHVEQVHRAAIAPRDAGRLAEQLRHDRVGSEPTRERRSVVAVAREQVVALAEPVDRADVRGLLADAEVAVAPDAGARVLLLGALLEATHQVHRAVEPSGGCRVLRDIAALRDDLGHRAQSCTDSA